MRRLGATSQALDFARLAAPSPRGGAPASYAPPAPGMAAAAMASAASGVNGLDEATALLFAAERGAARSIQSWMARGGDVNGTLVAQAGGCYTPLQLCAYTGHAIAVRTLLSCGADPALTAVALGGPGAAQAGAAPVGHLPLHLAARYGHAAALEALLEGGVDPNAVSGNAAKRGRLLAGPPAA